MSQKRKREEEEDTAGEEEQNDVKRLKITPIATSKDKIKQPELAEQNVIPRICSAIILNGSTSSGKTTLLANLLTKKQFYKGWFDRIFLISPTGHTDDIQKYLELPEEDIIDDLGSAPEFIQALMDSQRDQIKKLGNDKAPQYCIIFEDCIGDTLLMATPQFIKCFIACRHYNFTTVISSQAFNVVPRRCRLQAMNVFFFKGSNSEVEVLSEEYCPPGYDKKQFMAMISWATAEDYAFLHINKRVPFKDRYRRNLDEIIVIDQFLQQVQNVAMDDNGNMMSGGKGGKGKNQNSGRKRKEPASSVPTQNSQVKKQKTST
jgi:hypothetical protein